MGKTISASMQTHLESEVTSLSTCLAIVRKDETVHLVTDHDQDIEIDGVFGFPISHLNGVYRASYGFERSAIQHEQDAVANADMAILLHMEGVTLEDIRSEKFDNARVYVFLVSWEDLSRGVVKLPGSGWIGDMESRARTGGYKMELRGLGQAMKNVRGENYAPSCRVDLFSRPCSQDESAFVQHGVVSTVTDNRTFESSYVPAGFADTAQTIANFSFETAGVGSPANWTDEAQEAAGSSDGPWIRISSGGGLSPTDGTRWAVSDQSTPGPDPASVFVNRPYALRSDEITITGPGGFETDLDNGLAVMDVAIDLAARTSADHEPLYSSAAIGIIWYDTLGDEINRARSAEINDRNHLLSTTALTTHTRRFSVPPLARSFAIRIFAIKKNSAFSLASISADNVRATLKPTPAIATSTDREGNALPDWFDHGLVVFRSGANAGVAREVETYTEGSKDFVLFMPLPNTPAAGDVFEVYPGCKKRWLTDCVLKYDNGQNFRGEPFVPGDDFIFAGATTRPTTVAEW